jgi:CTP-dependent riboflavin kinase
MENFAEIKIEIRRKDYPQDTMIKTNQEWVNVLDVSEDYANRLIKEKLQNHIVNRIASERCSGCNYRLEAIKLSDNVYELR